MLRLKTFEFNPFGEVTVVLYDDVSRHAIVVDPGMLFDSERRVFDDFIASEHLQLLKLLHTHLHLDHCFGSAYLRAKYGTPLCASAADAELGLSLGQQCRRFGLPGHFEPLAIDTALTNGDTIAIADTRLEVIAVPGHSPGGLAYYCADYGFVISGDCLFGGSIGRTDLPGGDYATLVDSIRCRLLTLPDETLVVAGHGNATNIGAEKEYNPYLR